MAAEAERLELKIDLPDRSGQRALALATLTPRQLIAAILQEFDEVDYLGTTVDPYVLVNAEDGSILDPSLPLRGQLGATARLTLREHEVAVPEGAQRPARTAYLRETATGAVYKVNWLPALIGRPDRNQPHDDLCVDLESHPSGMRVSRRHAQLTAHNGEFYLEALSSNPTLLRREQETIPASSERIALQPGDIIVLARSDISLKFILLEQDD